MIEDKNITRTPLSELGEFGLIQELTKDFQLQQTSTQKGIGDDGAVLDFYSKKCVVSTDLLLEGIHFDLGYMPLMHLGYKAVVVNLSDICAMNAIPTQITFSLAVSNRFPLEALQELYSGVRAACKQYNVDLVGGDTTSSRQGMLISVTAIGQGDAQDLTYRNGAKPNDLLIVSGDLGSAYMGLQVLEREKAVFRVNPNLQPDLTVYDYLLQRQLRPEARTDVVAILKQLEVKPTAMIDISDGLSSEILHLCKQSNVGCRLVEEKIPMDPQLIRTCEEFHIDSTTVALNGGEDYELLFTINPSDYEKIKGNPNFTAIGYITEPSQGVNLITRGDELIAIKARGWNHLS